MSFNEEKFQNLSSLNRLKKLAYHLRDSILGRRKTETNRTPEIGGQLNNNLYKEMIEWINKIEHRKFIVPTNKTEKEILYAQVMDIILKSDPYAETVIFDNPSQKRTVFDIHVILDNIRSPFNVGSIFRTCESFGVSSLLLLGITPNPSQNTKIQRTAKQSIIDHQAVSDSSQLKHFLKPQAILIGIEKTNHSKPLDSFTQDVLEPHRPYYFILGNEEFGISQELLEQCQSVYHIPLIGMKNSLNVSVAGGIAFHHIARIFSKK